MRNYLRNPVLMLVLAVLGLAIYFAGEEIAAALLVAATVLALGLREGLKQIGRAMLLQAFVGQSEDSEVHTWAGAERGVNGKKSLLALYDSEETIT